MARLYGPTWEKIYKLGTSSDRIDFTYGEILATAIKYRINKNITQSGLSKISGLSTSVISKLESQNSVPSIKTFLKYINGLGLDLAFIEKNSIKKG